MSRNCQIIFVFLLIAQISWAQKSESDPKSRHFILVPEVHHLRSTHSQTIYGASVMVGYRITPTLWAGFGCEVSRTDSLFTHDRHTRVLKFTPVPIYAEARFDLIRNSIVTPYLNLAAGMSFITYERKRLDTSGSMVDDKHIFQNGFFFKGGAGLLFHLSNTISPSINASLKGFHMSGNPYEINPHGVTIQAGVVVKIGNR
ncbi:MAG TPA: hypothetical protein VK517_14985 [Cyclobacteriaceae bacterium]|jgi:hypothetical protein|nr:hypothetical protein [Cyclobacteriaceae bacterium]